MANPNSMLSDTLRQSLQDVLSEVSLDGDMMMRAPSAVFRQPHGLQSPFALPPRRAPVPSLKDFGFLTHVSRNFPLASAPIRPSAALGISSEELIRAAANEKRFLEEKVMMIEFGRARAALRHKALQDALVGRGQQSPSLLGLFQQGASGAIAAPQALPALPKKLAAQPQEPPKDALQEIGTTLRQKCSPYIDVADAADPDPNDSRVKKTRGGVTEPFPEKLHRLLKEIADDGNDDVISFYSHGRAFGIHQPEKFVSEIMPKYFKQSRLASFQRQLNLYGFKKITGGHDAGGYYHELFLLGRPNMCLHMRRVGLPKGGDRRKMRSKNIQVNPDFYAMKALASTGCSS